MLSSVRPSVVNLYLFGALVLSSVVQAAEPDNATMTMRDCQSYQPAILRTDEVQGICERMIGQLGPSTRRQDIENMEKAVWVFKTKGLPGSNLDTAQALIDIIQLRGLAGQPDRWRSTIDIAFKGWTVMNVMPVGLFSALRSAGPLAKTLDDNGLAGLIVLTHHCILQDSICPQQQIGDTDETVASMDSMINSL